MRTLVIGGSGFIGSHLVDALLHAGHKVRVFDRNPEPFRAPVPGVEYSYHDFNDVAALAEALEGVDVVYHLLCTTVPSTSNLDPISDIQSNLIGTVKLLQLMLKKGVVRIVYLSSGGTVYGVPSTIPVPEEHPLQPICSYGVVKVATENYLFMFQELYGLRPVILRPSNPYGERQGHGGVQGVIGTFLRKIKASEKIEIWGDGSVVRDYVHISDLISLCLKVVERDSCGVFNAGSGVGHSVLEILNVIEAVTGISVDPVFKPSRNYDVPSVILDTSKATRKFDWQPRVDLSEGVTSTWRWMNDAASEKSK
ncbi:MAG: NAD-dependent epimerase/dehydratase family protein [Nitrosomonadales bacterium]|nr:NAD-dependent epimerase/dehydratase family protein [Nitrosomonadales bacterium]